MTSSSPPRAPNRTESSSTPKPPSRRRDRPHSSKCLASSLHRSISGDTTSSPPFPLHTIIGRTKSSEGELATPPQAQPEKVRRRATRTPTSAPGRRNKNVDRDRDSLSDHFRGDGNNNLPSIDIHSSSRSAYTNPSISKTKASTSKRSTRPKSLQSHDDSIVGRRRVRDRSVNSDLEPPAPTTAPTRPQSLKSPTKPPRRKSDASVISAESQQKIIEDGSARSQRSATIRPQSLKSPTKHSRRKSDASAISAESQQKSIEDGSARSQRSASSSRARGRSDADDAENGGHKIRSKSKARMSSRSRSKSSIGRRARRNNNRSDMSASVSNMDAVSSSTSVTTDGDGSVVSNNSRPRRTKAALAPPVSPLPTQLESLMLEDKSRSRRRNKDSSSVASETRTTTMTTNIPREPSRVVQRNSSSDAAELASLTIFLKTEDAQPIRRNASSRSVSSMPIPRRKKGSERSLAEGQKRAIRKQTKLRMVKSDDEGVLDVLEKKTSLRKLRTCQTDEEGEVEDSQDEKSLHETDSLHGGRDRRSGKDARRSTRHYSTGQAAVMSDEENGVDNHQVDRSAHDRMGMSMPSMSLKVMELGALVQQQKAQKTLSKTTSMSTSENNHAEDEEYKEEDIFTFYSWSTSRQPRSKILKERKKLRDSVREGALLASYEALMRIE
jgi:hypothetical protein